MNLKSLLIASTLVFATANLAGCAVEDGSTEAGEEDLTAPSESLTSILAGIEPGTTWSQLPSRTKQLLERHARSVFAKQQDRWGSKALREKESVLLKSPTTEMTANYDRLLKFLFSADVPADFVASRDIKNANLAKQLRRLYLVYLAERRHAIALAYPDIKDWDGKAVTEMALQDERTQADQETYAADVESQLRRIGASSLSAVEKAIHAKAFFVARQLKHGSYGISYGGDDLRQAGTSVGWLYDHLTAYGNKDITPDDEAFLRAVNAHTFQKLVYANAGTLDVFTSDLPMYSDPAFLKDYGIEADGKLGKAFIVLQSLWQDRVTASADGKRKCTVYSSATTAKMWDSFTADNFTNADGKETLSSYAATYKSTVTARAAQTQAVARDAIEATFPTGSALLTATQKAEVIAAISAENRPAAILETAYAALDKATGKDAARKELEKAFSELKTVGGNYEAGAAPRPQDVATVNAMWENLKGYVAKHYSGYRVDIASLLPATVKVTTGDTSFADAVDGSITVALATEWQVASLYGVLIHEAKHAIDVRSKAPVFGAAWEGGGLAADLIMSPRFIDEVMASEASRLPHYRLGTEIANVRTTATTDATLQIYLRKECNGDAPSSIEFAKQVIASYGYSDGEYQLARSRRAHAGLQYLSYDYGSVIVSDQIKWLQQEVGAAVTVDPYLLQACGIASADKNAQVLADFKSCIAAKK